MIAALQRQATRLVLAGGGVCLAFIVVDLLLAPPGPWAMAFFWAGLALVVVGLVFVFLVPGRDDSSPARAVECPVRGRWLAMNSPASKVPSHGIRAYGQAFAIDLVHEPLEGQQRPDFGSGSGMAPPSDFPAFGQPVHAMVDGTVTRVRDRQRDHRSRNSWWSVLVMTVEGSLRELRGSDGVIGNHVVIDAGGDVFALVAHLQQGSAAVAEGDVVAAGDLIGRCGNTGNSSEPHVHAQLMDRPTPSTARGLPMEFAGVGMPANGEHLVG